MSVYRIRAQELTEKAFKAYGTVIQVPDHEEDAIAEDRYTYWPAIGMFHTTTGQVQIGITRLFMRPFRTCVMERQFETESIMFPITGDILLIVSANLGMDPEEIVDYKAAEAFIIRQGKGVIFRPGVWYWTPNPIGGDQDVLCCVQNPGDQDRCIKQGFPRGETLEVLMPELETL